MNSCSDRSSDFTKYILPILVHSGYVVYKLYIKIASLIAGGNSSNILYWRKPVLLSKKSSIITGIHTSLRMAICRSSQRGGHWAPCQLQSP